MNETVDQQYANLIADVLKNGEDIVTRNSRVKRLFAKTLRFTTTPLISVRKTAWKKCIREWEWFLSGSNCLSQLHPSVRSWWEPWTNSEGFIANNYSQQFRAQCGAVDAVEGGVDLVTADQIEIFVDGIKNHPFSRRNVISTWNTAEMVHPSTPITNCHNTVTQAFVDVDGLLHLVTYQRSADVVCGLPHNLLQMAAFHLWLVSRTGRKVGSLTWIGGDIHIYESHFDLADEIVRRVGECGPTPTLIHRTTCEEFRADDFDIEGDYNPVILTRARMVV